MILHADGLFEGERLRGCSQRARLFWPYFFLLANGYARLELDWNKLAARFWSFPEPPTAGEIEAFFSDYGSHHLLFVYTDKSKKWGQWDTRRGNLPDYRNAADKRTPEPPSPDYELWLQEYHGERWREHDCREAALRSRQREARVSFAGDSRENRATVMAHTRKDFPVGVGGGEGVGERQETHLSSQAPNSQEHNPPRVASESGRLLAQTLRQRILENNPTARITDAQVAKWAVEVDRMIRIDGRTEEQIRTLIDWSQSDPFWLKNILSMSKLRQQFDRLTLARRSEQRVVVESDNGTDDSPSGPPQWSGLPGSPRNGSLE